MGLAVDWEEVGVEVVTAVVTVAVVTVVAAVAAVVARVVVVEDLAAAVAERHWRQGLTRSRPSRSPRQMPLY